MIEKIIVSLASSILGALVMFAALNSADLLTKQLSDSQINAVALRFVDDEITSGTLLRKMDEQGTFKGETGPEGPKGEAGAVGAEGPAWEPKLSTFELVATKSEPRSGVKLLGEHKFCALSRAGEPHEKQACICEVAKNSSEWKLSVNVDESVSGGCYCSAICMN